MASPELQICAAVQQAVGWDRVAVVAADGLEHRLPLPGSDAVLRHYGDLQQSLSQGPGADVLAAGAPVLVDDLRVPVERWTVLMGSVPTGFPVRSLAAVPLISGRRLQPFGGASQEAVPGAEGVSGVLVAARDAVAPFTTAQLELLEALAALVVVVAEQRIASGGFFAPEPPVSGAGPGRVPGDEVAMVVGMLRVRLSADESGALAWLRAHAFAAGTTIHQVASAVVAGRLSIDDLTRPV